MEHIWLASMLGELVAMAKFAMTNPEYELPEPYKALLSDIEANPTDIGTSSQVDEHATT